MIDLIKADIYKMTKSSFIKILIGISAISAGLMLTFAHLIAAGSMDIQNTGIASFFADSQIFTLLGCVIIGMFLCGDFEYKIIENSISSGHSRSAVVVGKVISLVILVSILSLPYIIAGILAAGFNLEVSVYMPTAYLTIMGYAVSGAGIAELLVLIILAIVTYSAQLCVGIFIMFLVKKSVIAIAMSYAALLLLGPVLSLNESSKKIMAYTPFGIDYTKLVSDFEITNFIESISCGFIFIIIFTFLSMLSFEKCEIK